MNTLAVATAIAERVWLRRAIIERCERAKASGDDQYRVRHATTVRVLKQRARRL